MPVPVATKPRAVPAPKGKSVRSPKQTFAGLKALSSQLVRFAEKAARMKPERLDKVARELADKALLVTEEYESFHEAQGWLGAYDPASRPCHPNGDTG